MLGKMVAKYGGPEHFLDNPEKLSSSELLYVLRAMD